MDKQEYKAWLAETNGSKLHWQIDEVTRHNQGVYLIFKGGISGQYIRIEGGFIEIGDYEGAIPHIGEASFSPGYTSKRYRDNDEALSKITVALGRKFLMDLLGMRVYPQSGQPEWLKTLASGGFSNLNGNAFDATLIAKAAL